MSKFSSHDLKVTLTLTGEQFEFLRVAFRGYPTSPITIPLPFGHEGKFCTVNINADDLA